MPEFAWIAAIDFNTTAAVYLFCSFNTEFPRDVIKSICEAP